MELHYNQLFFYVFPLTFVSIIFTFYALIRNRIFVSTYYWIKTHCNLIYQNQKDFTEDAMLILHVDLPKVRRMAQKSNVMVIQGIITTIASFTLSIMALIDSVSYILLGGVITSLVILCTFMWRLSIENKILTGMCNGISVLYDAINIHTTNEKDH